MTPEIQVINHLLGWLLITGFFTGIFFSHRFIDSICWIFRFYRRKRFIKRYRANHLK